MGGNGLLGPERFDSTANKSKIPCCMQQGFFLGVNVEYVIETLGEKR